MSVETDIAEGQAMPRRRALQEALRGVRMAADWLDDEPDLTDLHARAVALRDDLERELILTGAAA